MGTAERDIYKTGVLVNGLPTCIFPAASYARTVTNIVVGNSATSNVKCYRGLLGSTPVAQNLLGANNTLTGRIDLPAGQQFFVQWSALGTLVTDAFARVSTERVDSPLDRGRWSHSWATDAITSISIPNTGGPNDPVTIIGQDLKPELVAYETIHEGVLISNVIFQQDPSHYVYLAQIQGSSAQLAGGAYDAPDVSQAFSVFGGTGAVGNFLVGGPDGANFYVILGQNGDYKLQNGITPSISQGRGLHAVAVSQSNSGAIGGSDTVVLTATPNGGASGDSVTWLNGRAYAFVHGGRFTGSLANTTVVVRHRHTNAAGAIIVEGSHPLFTTAQWNSYMEIAINNSGSNISHPLVFTIGATAGTATMNGAATIPRYVYVYDIGSATDFAGFASIPA